MTLFDRWGKLSPREMSVLYDHESVKGRAQKRSEPLISKNCKGLKGFPVTSHSRKSHVIFLQFKKSHTT